MINLTYTPKDKAEFQELALWMKENGILAQSPQVAQAGKAYVSSAVIPSRFKPNGDEMEAARKAGIDWKTASVEEKCSVLSAERGAILKATKSKGATNGEESGEVFDGEIDLGECPEDND